MIHLPIMVLQLAAIIADPVVFYKHSSYTGVQLYKYLRGLHAKKFGASRNFFTTANIQIQSNPIKHASLAVQFVWLTGRTLCLPLVCT